MKRTKFHMSIRTKLIAGFVTILVMVILTGNIYIYTHTKKIITRRIESELQNTTRMIKHMITASADASIKNYLRAVAEKNLDILTQLYQDQTMGSLTEAKAKSMAKTLLLSQSIGKTGYIFALDVENAPKSIIITVHPVLTGQDVSSIDFVQNAYQMKNGYIEYQWKNPGEPFPRNKAMYFYWFKPWNWILAVSAYRDEFQDLIPVDTFKQRILAIRFGKHGYSFVVDSKGNAIIHPRISGMNLMAQNKTNRKWMEKICETKQGTIVYQWKNPGEKQWRQKIAVYDYIPEYDWIVASSSYLDEIYQPLDHIQYIMTLTLVVTVVLGTMLAWLLTTSVIRSLHQLIHAFEKGSQGDLNVRIPIITKDEIGNLASHFNTFMEQLSHLNNGQQQLVQQRTAELEIANQELKAAVECTKRMAKRAEIATSLKDQFIANMSHEIRTPLNAIVKMCGLVLQTDSMDYQRQYITTLKTSTQSLLLLINDIVDISLMKSGKITLNRTEFNIRKIVDEVISLFQLSVLEKQLELSVSITDNVPEWVIGDPVRLRHALSNLLSNAVKFTEKGAIRVYVDNRSASPMGPNLLPNIVELQFTIQDTGIGIAPDVLDQLFDMFSQPDDVSNSKYGTTGLGLAICRYIVSMMGGAIQVKSNPGFGSRFSFTARFGTIQHSAMEYQHQTDLFSNFTLTSSKMPNLRVLFVENHAANRRNVIDILESAGIHVDTAENGIEAVDTIREGIYDAVIMNFQLPLMNGIEVSKVIRRELKMHHLPIIILAGSEIHAKNGNWLKEGINGSVSYPINSEELLATLGRSISMMKAEFGENNGKSELEAINSTNALNIREGLRRLDGAIDMYLALINHFRESRMEIVGQFWQLIHAKNYSEARLLIHSLKGDAGAICAKDLMQAARALENACKHKMENNSQIFDSDFDQLVTRLEKELRRVMNAIQKLRDKSHEYVSHSKDTLPVFIENTIDMDNVFEQLKKSLLEYDPVESDKYLKIIQKYSRNGIADEIRLLVQRLTRETRNYKFEEATETLKRLAQLWK